MVSSRPRDRARMGARGRPSCVAARAPCEAGVAVVAEERFVSQRRLRDSGPHPRNSGDADHADYDNGPPLDQKCETIFRGKVKGKPIDKASSCAVRVCGRGGRRRAVERRVGDQTPWASPMCLVSAEIDARRTGDVCWRSVRARASGEGRAERIARTRRRSARRQRRSRSLSG
jgi:hypothetical protein